MKLKWFPSPTKTEFGHGMVVADIAITKDNTLTIYCEEEMVEKVNEMFKKVKEYDFVQRTN